MKRGVVEMVTPADGQGVTLAKDNKNSFLSSIAAWLQGAGPDAATVGGRDFAGFPLFEDGILESLDISKACKDALYQTVYCDDMLWEMRNPEYHHSLGDSDAMDSLCDAGCGRSLATVQNSVSALCGLQTNLIPGVPAISSVERLWWAYNDTCFKDPTTGRYCNDLIDSYNIENLSDDQMCSYCFTTKYQQMQQSAYSMYNSEFGVDVLEAINAACSLSAPTAPTEPMVKPVINTEEPLNCISDSYYTTVAGDTCDSIAIAQSVSASTLWAINPSVLDCNAIPAGLELCLPQTCTTYQVQAGDDCVHLAISNSASWINIIDWNGGGKSIDYGCTNLVDSSSPDWGSVICISAPGEPYTVSLTANSSIQESAQPGYTRSAVVDPPADAVLATNTTTNCGLYYSPVAADTCETICLRYTVSAEQFVAYNPSLATSNCTASLQPDLTYCVLATEYWDVDDSQIPWGQYLHEPFEVSTNGSCGLPYKMTCLDSGFGDCCSYAGVCGSSDEECAPDNCWGPFGTCNTI